MPFKGDEFHHFGWNACSSALSPLIGHAFLERRYLIIPGIRSSRIYVVDTKPDPTKATIHKIIEPEEVFKKTGYSRPHTVHCGPEGMHGQLGAALELVKLLEHTETAAGIGRQLDQAHPLAGSNALADLAQLLDQADLTG